MSGWLRSMRSPSSATISSPGAEDTIHVDGPHDNNGVGLTAGGYQLRYDPATLPDGYFATTPTVLNVTLASAQQYGLADFGLRAPEDPGVGALGSIGDTAWIDANEDGVVACLVGVNILVTGGRLVHQGPELAVQLYPAQSHF